MVLVLALVAPLHGASGASASPTPGTPVEVAAGVPGNGRAWELVTLPDPTTAGPYAPKAISASGDELSYLSFGPVPGATRGYPLILPNLAKRGADGWSTTPISYPEPDSEFALSFGPEAFGPDLEESIWANELPEQPEQPGEKGIYRRTADGTFELIAVTADGAPVRGASADLQHVLLTTNKHMLPADASRTEGLSIYEVDGTTLRLVDVGNDGSLLSDCGSVVPEWDPISRDGRRIFFTTRPGCSGPARAYLREDRLTTTLISASQCTLADCGPEADVSILGATPSGSSAFLVTSQKLTNEDTDESADLYRYDLQGGQLALLSAMPGTDLVATEDEVRPSADGSRALFWAEDPSVGSGKHLYLATPGGPRLLAPSAESFVQISSDGRYVLFASKEALNIDDTDESLDVYRYDADAESLTRISAGPSGGNGAFEATIYTGFNAKAVSTQPYQAMSTDGSDVFFDTGEQLLPQDRNEVTDIYEWHEGDLDLVSSGSGDHPSIYLGAAPDGRTAFFATTQTLLPRDRDGGDVDFYAARVGGGFQEPSVATPCEEESCLPPLGEPTPRAMPGSAVPNAGTIRLARPSSEARRRIAASGWLTLMAEVPTAGRLSAQARARVDRRTRLVASRSFEVASAGAVEIRMRLSSLARWELSRNRRLHVQVSLRLSHTGPADRIEFPLGGGR